MIIGVVGGMGSYATLNFFERYLNLFRADKEWDRPRIVIDNRCTMPSRVRAILYDEKWDEVVAEIADSIEHLIACGCERIVLACNTSHVFLENVFERLPDARNYVVHIIDSLVQEILNDSELSKKEFSLIATEGTILSGIYQKTFDKYGVKIVIPGEESFPKLRTFIEAVKTNSYNDEVLRGFANLMKEQPSCNVILGCTEFPVIYDKMKQRFGGAVINGINVYDPLDSTLKVLYREFKMPKKHV